MDPWRFDFLIRLVSGLVSKVHALVSLQWKGNLVFELEVIRISDYLCVFCVVFLKTVSGLSLSSSALHSDVEVETVK